jgi:HlyD family secretion protein
MILRAPFDGVVAELSIEVGEWTTPSPPVIQVPAVIDVIDTSSIYVSAPMDEVDAARLRPGLPARVAIDSHPGRHFPGHVVRVSAYVLDVEEQNRTVEIEVELDDVAFAATLLPGTSADVEVILEARDAVLRVPTGALLSGDKVLVVEGGRLVERAVETGLRNWDLTETRSGLAEGDMVVVSLDRAEVKGGARVTVERERPS